MFIILRNLCKHIVSRRPQQISYPSPQVVLFLIRRFLLLLVPIDMAKSSAGDRNPYTRAENTSNLTDLQKMH